MRLTQDDKSESGKPGRDVGQGPEKKNELYRLENVFDEDEFLGLGGQASEVFGENIDLSVDLLLREDEVLVKVVPEKWNLILSF